MVATLGMCFAVQRVKQGNSQLLEAAGHRSLFASPLWLTHAQDNRSMVGHDGRVERVNGIGMVGLRLVVVEHFCSALAQQVCQGIVLLLRYRQVRTIAVMPR